MLKRENVVGFVLSLSLIALVCACGRGTGGNQGKGKGKADPSFIAYKSKLFVNQMPEEIQEQITWYSTANCDESKTKKAENIRYEYRLRNDVSRISVINAKAIDYTTNGETIEDIYAVISLGGQESLVFGYSDAGYRNIEGRFDSLNHNATYRRVGSPPAGATEAIFGTWQTDCTATAQR